MRAYRIVERKNMFGKSEYVIQRRMLFIWFDLYKDRNKETAIHLLNAVTKNIQENKSEKEIYRKEI